MSSSDQISFSCLSEASNWFDTSPCYDSSRQDGKHHTPQSVPQVFSQISGAKKAEEEDQQQSEGLELSIFSPLDQFEIRDLLSLDAPILANLHLSITNIGLYLTITAAICLALNFLATNYNKVTANN